MVMKRFAVVAAGALAAGCAVVSTTPLNPSPRKLVPRRPEQVEMFSSAPPARPHVDVSFIELNQDLASPTELITNLRTQAAQMGCDAMVISGRLSSESKNAAYGTCVVYTGSP
jgi:hypothetical protein